MSQYFVVDTNSGQKYGPADLATLNQWATEGRVAANTILEDATTAERMPASMVPGLVIPGAQAPSSPPQPQSAPTAQPTTGQSFGAGPVGTPVSPYPREQWVNSGGFGGYPPGVYFDFIGKAWEYIKPNLLMWVVATLIYFAIAGVGGQIIGIPMNIVGYGSPFGTGELVNPIGFFALFVPTIALQLAISYLTTAGLIQFALGIIDGNEPDFGLLFKPFSTIVQGGIAGLLTGLATFFGFMLCLIPGFYVLGRLAFVNILISDQGMTSSEAIKTCWDRMAPFAWAMAGLYIVTGIVSGLGFLLCCIGIFLTFPFLYLVLAMQYRVIFPEFASSKANTIGGQAPSAGR